MDGFLVLLRCRLDDLPTGLYATRGEALAVAAKVGPEPSDHMRALVGDVSGTVSVAVVGFRHGRPCTFEIVRVFDGERAAAPQAHRCAR